MADAQSLLDCKTQAGYLERQSTRESLTAGFASLPPCVTDAIPLLLCGQLGPGCIRIVLRGLRPFLREEVVPYRVLLCRIHLEL